VALSSSTPRLQAALGLPRDRGALVQDVPADSPAGRAGLRPYDLITAIDDVAVASDDALIRYISARVPGTMVHLDVWRDQARRRVSLKLTERPLPPTVRAPVTTGGVRPVLSSEQGPLGLTVRDLDAATSKRFTLPEGMVGVMIVDVDSAGPARQARVRRGQVVLEINRVKIGSVAEFNRAVSALGPGAAVALFVFDPLTGDRAIYSIAIDPA
jgi:serine protease Do